MPASTTGVFVDIVHSDTIAASDQLSFRGTAGGSSGSLTASVISIRMAAQVTTVPINVSDSGSGSEVIALSVSTYDIFHKVTHEVAVGRFVSRHGNELALIGFCFSCVRGSVVRTTTLNHAVRVKIQPSNSVMPVEAGNAYLVTMLATFLGNTNRFDHSHRRLS